MVNNAPAVTTPENTPYDFAAVDFGFTAPSGSSATLNAVDITTLPTVGTLTDNGANVTAGQFVSVSDINSGLLVYTPVTNTVGSPYDTFTFQVQSDDDGIDPNPKTMTINVLGLSGTSNTVTTSENTPYLFAAADFGLTEPAGSPPYTLKAVEISSLPAVGTLADNGSNVLAGQFVSVNDINAGLLAFAPAANTSGIPYDGFNFQVQDNSGFLNGGDTDPIPRIMTINVLASTTTTLSASVNPALLGQNVTFAATVVPDPSATAIPTGVVTYLDGTTVLGTATLDSSGNVPTLTLNTLTMGVHTITASYPGDVNFASSVSNVITLPVQGTPVVSVDTLANFGGFGSRRLRTECCREVLSVIPI